MQIHRLNYLKVTIAIEIQNILHCYESIYNYVIIINMWGQDISTGSNDASRILSQWGFGSHPCPTVSVEFLKSVATSENWEHECITGHVLWWVRGFGCCVCDRKVAGLNLRISRVVSSLDPSVRPLTSGNFAIPLPPCLPTYPAGLWVHSPRKRYLFLSSSV